MLNFLLYGTTAKFVCIFNLQVCFGNSLPHVHCQNSGKKLYDSSFFKDNKSTQGSTVHIFSLSGLNTFCTMQGLENENAD